jgi:hypothetical protein
MRRLLKTDVREQLLLGELQRPTVIGASKGLHVVILPTNF